MDKQFKRILDLVRRTGDRMVVTDTNGEDAYVVMGLDAYESLVEAQELFDEDFFDAEQGEIPAELPFDIPDDLMVPETRRTDRDEVPPPPEPPAEVDLADEIAKEKRIWDAMQPAKTTGQTWDLSQLTEAELQEVRAAHEELKAKRAALPQVEEPKSTQEEPKKEPGEDEFGEEQFYLEPIE